MFDPPSCAYGHFYGKNATLQVHSLMGTWCKDLSQVGALGRAGVDALGVVGNLEVHLLNSAGTDSHQFYGCV